MVDPGKVEKEVKVIAIELSAASSQLSAAADPICWLEVSEHRCCSVLLFAWRSGKFLPSCYQPEVVGVRE